MTIYTAGRGAHRRFYRLLPGKYPLAIGAHWVLWQRVVQRRFLWWSWWADKDEPFWLDRHGFTEF